MNLPTYIKEKRAEFDPRCRMMDGFLYYREEDAIAFLETCLTQLVEKMEEESPKTQITNTEEIRAAMEGAVFLKDEDYETIRQMNLRWNECVAETRRRFHLFKTGEEHTGV